MKGCNRKTKRIIFYNVMPRSVSFLISNFNSFYFDFWCFKETFKIKIPSRYSNFSTTFFNAHKEVISYGELKDKCRIKILMETSGIWSNSRCTSFYFHAKEVLTDLRN